MHVRRIESATVHMQFILAVFCLVVLDGCLKDTAPETIPQGVLDRQDGRPVTSTKKAKEATVPEDQSESQDDEAQTPMAENLPPVVIPPVAPQFPDEVRPPEASDLAVYLKDISGEGPLLADFVTSMGTVTCELEEKLTPITVANFVGLATGAKPFEDPKSGDKPHKRYFDGTVFHRVIPGFMIQGGDPLGVGRGGPGYEFSNEIVASLKHNRPGVLAMANAGPGTNGSQFYITETAAPHLDGKHTVFGQCENVGLVRKIARVERGSNDKPKADVTLKAVLFRRGEK